jgi:predicted nucleic acid-binding protein
MRYWDACAVLPLLVEEPATPAMVGHLRDDGALAVGWPTRVECWSALARLEREGDLDEGGLARAVGLLAEAAARWTEVPPLERVREQAIRLLRVHPLRAADAVQLASALVLCDFEPRALPFVTLDARLAVAARREGFEVLGL